VGEHVGIIGISSSNDDVSAGATRTRRVRKPGSYPDWTAQMIPPSIGRSETCQEDQDATPPFSPPGISKGSLINPTICVIKIYQSHTICHIYLNSFKLVQAETFLYCIVLRVLNSKKNHEILTVVAWSWELDK